MAHIVGLAQDLYSLACEEASLAASLRENYRSVVIGIMDGTTVGSVISGTKNGSTYNLRLSATLEERRAAMKMAINSLDSGIPPGGRSRNAFGRQYW